jgi:SLT domain-containing protein
MPTNNDGGGGSLHTLIALLHHSNAELHRDIVTELHNCHKLASQYAVEYDQRFAMPRAACRKAGGDANAVLLPS